MTTIQQTCATIIAASGIFLFGCSAWDGGYRGGHQPESASNMQFKSIAGVYQDVGPDGGLKLHPSAPTIMSQDSPSR